MSIRNLCCQNILRVSVQPWSHQVFSRSYVSMVWLQKRTKYRHIPWILVYEIYFHPSTHIWKTKASLLSVVVVLELNFFICLFRNCFSMISIFMAGSTRKRSRFKKTLWNQQSKISLMLLDYIILLYFLDEYTFFFSLLTLRNYRLSSLFHHSRPVVGNSQTDYFFNTFFLFLHLIFDVFLTCLYFR